MKELEGYRCACCGATPGEKKNEQLESHHVFPQRLYPELSDVLENGICLCHSCHYIAHASNYMHSGIEDLEATNKNTKCYKISTAILEQARTRIIISASPERYRAIAAHAKRQGESVNAFINRAIDEAMERDRVDSDGN